MSRRTSATFAAGALHRGGGRDPQKHHREHGRHQYAQAEPQAQTYSVYDNITRWPNVVRGQKRSPNIRRLIEAIGAGRQSRLHGYLSAHGGGVRDRRVEPLPYDQLRAGVVLRPRKATRTNSSKPRVSAPWSCPKRRGSIKNTTEGFIDAFACTAGTPPQVRLELGTLAYNLLCEEYPLAERDVKPLGRGTLAARHGGGGNGRGGPLLSWGCWTTSASSTPRADGLYPRIYCGKHPEKM